MNGESLLKIAGLQADMYKKTKPLVLKYLNARNPGDIKKALGPGIALKNKTSGKALQYIEGMEERAFPRGRVGQRLQQIEDRTMLSPIMQTFSSRW